jgi:asparagine synthase (glutamine-hydrolysing)
MASKRSKNLKTFTVAFTGAYNEAPLAKLVAKKFNTTHTQIQIDFKDLQTDLEHIISNYGEPFMDSSAIPSYYVSKEAKKYSTVILNGDGADELFGGYRRYVPFSKFDFFEKNELITYGSKKLSRLLPQSHDKKTRYNYFNRLVNLTAQTGIDIYLAATTDVFIGYEKYFKNSPNLTNLKKDYDYINNTLEGGLNKIMCLDFENLLFGDLLVKMDIANMANSLEGRSPFLSKEFLNYAPMLPTEFKIKRSQTKYILREIAAKMLPEEISKQPKRGFEIPLKDWVNSTIKDLLHSYLESPNAYFKNFIDKNFVYNLLNNNLNIPSEKRAKMLYSILCLEIWYSNFKTNQSLI